MIAPPDQVFVRPERDAFGRSSRPVDGLAQWQASSGAFAATLHRHGRSDTAHNAFVTAHVLRGIRLMAGGSDPAGMRARGLDYLERCESSERPGAFGFWPESDRPAWVGDLPPDADDTAIVWLELVASRRRSVAEARRAVCHVLVPFRAGESLAGPPWLREGVFTTWLRRGGPLPVVDCVVNVNVVALATRVGLTDVPGVREACDMLYSALDWAGDDVARARSLSPFYPHPAELRLAIDHAVACGVGRLRSAQLRVRAAPWAEEDAGWRLRPVCGSAYGAVTWSAPALQDVRRACGLIGPDAVRPTLAVGCEAAAGLVRPAAASGHSRLHESETLRTDST